MILRGLKALFFSIIRQKTALPVIFLVVISFINFLIINDFKFSENKLPPVLVNASMANTNSIITASSLQSADNISPEKNVFIYNKFLKNNFIVPTTGKNWGVKHGKNGVDIADVCGKIIYAAEEGLVISISSNSAWNDGYGNFLTIEHPSGVQTKYAHTKKNLVKKDSYVLQGDPIALIGNTGLTHGSTGCHLHFEVLGGVNPFVK